MPIKQITPEEAHQLVQSGSAYIDVRTEGEFAAGHPAAAVNIPIVMPHSATGQMQVNPDFVAVVLASFPRQAALVIGCQSGGRSQRAAEMLEQAGYVDVSNVRGGFGGLRDQTGATVVPGWAELGLPTSTACTDANTYRAMKARAERGSS